MASLNDIETKIQSIIDKFSIKTITGVLPLTFTGKGGTAADWVMYGNDDNGTENLVSPIRIANGWKQGYRQKNNGNYTTTHNNGEWLCDVYIPIDSTSFTFWATSISEQASGTFYFFDNNKGYLRNTAIDIDTYNNAVISDLPANAAYVQFAFRTYCMSEQEIIDNNYQVMLVKGSTAPDHYIPYQIGVGERTENVMPSAVNGTYTSSRLTVVVENGVYHVHIAEGTGSATVSIPIPEFTIPLAVSGGGNGVICFFNSKANSGISVSLRYNNVSIINGYSMAPINRTLTNYDYLAEGQKCDEIQIYVAVAVSEYDMDICPCIVDTGVAHDTFIPYGYQIPITVSQQGETDKNYDIYIGDTPLTEGETVSKTSTGQDIELFEGENVVSTTLYNKLTMKINYNGGN